MGEVKTTREALADNVRYALMVPSTSRRRCPCGCKQRAAYFGFANGVCLTTACQLAIRRWVKFGTLNPQSNRAFMPQYLDSEHRASLEKRIAATEPTP